jgi:hypothetical protein
MKRFIIYLCVLSVTALGCQKDKYLTYSDINRVQLNDTSAMSATFVYDAASVTKDTIYIQVNTIGKISDHDRAVKLEQVKEYVTTYVRDPVTNKVTDSVVSEVPYEAVAGVHYLPLDDASLAPLMVVKADSVHAMIPIVLLRDTSLKTNSYRLRIQLVANNDFGLGEEGAREKTIIFSDHLERFYSWSVDNYTAPAWNNFGKYSTGKHQFMINTLGVNIDEAWYQAALAAGALPEYQNLLKQALADFNSNPANIASGKAPVRETDNPYSTAITFP